MNSSLDPSACIRQWTSLPDEALRGETSCDWRRTEGTIHCLITAYSLHFCFDLLCFCFNLRTLQTSCQRSVYVVDRVPSSKFQLNYAIWREGVSSLGRYIDIDRDTHNSRCGAWTPPTCTVNYLICDDWCFQYSPPFLSLSYLSPRSCIPSIHSSCLSGKACVCVCVCVCVWCLFTSHLLVVLVESLRHLSVRLNLFWYAWAD